MGMMEKSSFSLHILSDTPYAVPVISLVGEFTTIILLPSLVALSLDTWPHLSNEVLYYSGV